MREFVIPLTRAELTKSSPSQYFVADISSPVALRSEIPNCRDYLGRSRLKFVLKAFDSLFSVLKHWTSVTVNLREEAWEIVLKGCKESSSQLVELLDEDCSVDQVILIRNSIKMICYLLAQYIEMLHNDICDAGLAVLNKGRGRLKKDKMGGFGSDKYHIDWKEEALQALNILQEMFELHLNKFWTPPILEEDFVSLIGGCCYKVMEDANMAKVPEFKQVSAQLLHQLIRHHNYSANCSVKLAQMLQCYAHTPSCIMTIVQGFIERSTSKVVVQALLKEISSFKREELERDTQAAKNFSCFLQEFAALYPSYMLSTLPFMKDRLEEDPYTMRSCALVVIGEIVRQTYKCKSTSSPTDPRVAEKDELQREKLLDILEDHVTDINGLVRAKSLSIWATLVGEDQCLTLKRKVRILNFLVGDEGAIVDVSSHARKHAVIILTHLTHQNVTGKLSLEKLRERLEMERKKLDELETRQDPQFVELEKKWPQVLQEIHKALCESISEELQNGEDAESDFVFDGTDEPEKVAQHIHKLLHSSRYKSAIKYFQEAQEQFCGNPMFCDIRVEPTGEQSSHDKEVEMERKMLVWLMKIKDIYLGLPLLCSSDDREIPCSQTAMEMHTEMVRQRSIVEFLSDSVEFARCIQQAIPTMFNLLNSKTTTDIQEAIEFFVKGFFEKIPGMEEGVRRMLSLVWSGPPNRTSVVEAYKRLYLNPSNVIALSDDPRSGQSLQGKQNSAEIVFNNLRTLMSDATLGEFLSLEELLGEFVVMDDFPENLRMYLVHYFTRRLPDTTAEQRKQALIILSMIASKRPELLVPFVNDILQEGLEIGADDGPARCNDTEVGDTSRAPDDLAALRLRVARGRKIDALLLVRYTCRILQYTIPLKLRKRLEHDQGKRLSDEQRNKPLRLPRDHKLFQMLKNNLIVSFDWVEDAEWMACMEQCLKTIYLLAEQPDAIARDIIITVAPKVIDEIHLHENQENLRPVDEPQLRRDSEIPITSTVDDSAADIFDGASMDAAVIPPIAPFDGSASRRRVSIPKLARFLALGGDVSLLQLVHLTGPLLDELKRRNVIREESKTNRKKVSINTTHSESFKYRSRNQDDRNDISKTTTLRTDNVESHTTMEEDMGLAGAAADDAESDLIQKITELGLVCHTLADEDDPSQIHPNYVYVSTEYTLLEPLANLTAIVCAQPEFSLDAGLQSCATLALAKHCLTSSQFAERNLPLLIALAEQSPHDEVRANLIIALGDLTRRFPNLIEPWTPKLYERLRDASCQVRVNALNTLSHLILNDMIKVKGQISELTTCIIDPQERLMHLSRLFFQELAQKGNALYNTMPDIISRLSNPELQLEEAKFRAIMDFLFPHITKEKQTESLVEKICQRFSGTKDERQWRDLAYCLSIMNYNEKLVRKLLENFNNYACCLHIDDVYENFKRIIASARKHRTAGPAGAGTRGCADDYVENLEIKIEEAHEKGVADEEALENAEQAAANARRKHQYERRRSRADKAANRKVRRTPTHAHQALQSPGESAFQRDIPHLVTPTRVTRQQNRTVKPLVWDSSEEESSGD